ncbi:MAG TPA: alpha/beta fold hydrolase, partial [Solirubrobacteraceae bacterium]|nr:alpha/beta fold hydrolase [Solirubrobacteraceae bacterium]
SAHLLDLAISGPATVWWGVLAILAFPAAWFALQPRLIRPTRFALGLIVGLLAVGFGVVSHGLHVVNSGPDWRDLTGVGMVVGGVLLIGSAVAALAAPAGPRGEHRALHAAGWLVGAVLVLAGLMSFAQVLLVTHAPRWAIQEASLPIPHDEVTVETADGRDLSAWWVPSRNGAAVLVDHGSGGSRERVVGHIRMLARHGYGVLALDLPGNGESEGHSNGLGDNAQPAVDAALDWLSRRDGVDRDRIAGYGLSLGAEVLIEAAAGDERLRAVVADGATRPEDAQDVLDPDAVQRAMEWLAMKGIRGVSGMRTSTSLNPLIEKIAPRPVLLVASGGFEQEIPANRIYREHGGATTELYELPDAGHTGGLRKHPEEFERRTMSFIDRALRE